MVGILKAIKGPLYKRAMGSGMSLLMLVEVRSVKGDLYGKGEPRERDAFVYNGHYRRFVRMEELVAELIALSFKIDTAIESAGLAVHKDDDPVVIRVVARRPVPS